MNIGVILPFLNSLSFERLLWLIPIFFALHNLEEAPSMESWSKQLPLKIGPTVSTHQFVIAVTFLTLAVFLITYIALNFLQRSTAFLLLLGIQAILLFNAFVPHIVTTIRFRMYSPGVVTAVLFTLPFSLYVFRRSFSENILTPDQFWMLVGVAPFAMVLFAYISLQIGKAFDKSN